MKQRVIAVCIALVAVWAIFVFWLMPAVIAAAYAGKSLAIINQFMAGRDTTPLAEYLATWRNLALLSTATIVFSGLLVYFARGHVARLPQFLRSSVVGLPASGAAGAVLFALWCGMIAGIAEAINGIIRHRIKHLPTGEVVSGELFWLAPLIAAVTFVAISLLLAGLDRLFRARYALLGLAAPLMTGLAVFSFLRAMRIGLASYAIALLALGVAVVTARTLSERAPLTRRFVRRATPALALLLIVWALAVPIWRTMRANRPPASPSRTADAPNVILVIWDAARAPNLSAYGYHRATTPTLQRLAQQGVLFERAYATSSWTLPSHAGMFTGRYPHELTAGYHTKLDETHLTIAEILAENGYATAGFTANLFYGSPSYGLARGFSYYDGRPSLKPATLLHTWWLSREITQHVRRRTGNYQDMLRRDATHGRRALVRWIREQNDRPFFAAVNWFDAHNPYIPPPPFDRAFSNSPAKARIVSMLHPITPELQRDLILAYDGCLRYLDHELGLLVEELRKMGKLENTLLIVTSDHGEMFGEERPFLSGHSLALFPSALQVPLVLSYPAKLPQNVRRSETVSIRDIPATIMSVVGLADRSPFPGTSLIKYIDGTATPQERAEPRLAETHRQRWAASLSKWPAARGDQFAVIDGNMEYIVDGIGGEHLYDIGTDYHAKHNLVRSPGHEPIVQRYRAVLDSLVPRTNGRRHAMTARSQP